MIVLFHLSMLATLIFLYVGIYGLKLNKDSIINRAFFVCCLSTTLWSFGTGLTYITTGYFHEFFFSISALGWCFESALFLNIVLLLTESKLIKNKIILFLLYVPGAVFYFLSIFVIRPNNIASGFICNFFYYGDSIYDITFSFISLFLIFIWTYKAKERSHEKQGRIILITGFITYILNNLNQGVLPLMGYKAVPPIAHLTNLILILGLYYASFRYKLLDMSESLVLDEIMYEMFDMVVIVSDTGKILNVNRSTCDLTGYSQKELEGANLDLLIKDKDFVSYIVKGENSNETIRYKKVWIKSKKGETIPLDLSCRHVMDSKNIEEEGVIIVGHDIRETIMLQEEINHHRELEEKLTESAESFKSMFYKHSAIMYLLNPDTLEIEDVNDAFKSYYGYSDEEIHGMNITKINCINEEHERIAIDNVSRLRTKNFEFKHKLANGNIRDVEVRASVIPFLKGKMVFSVVNDVTEKKKEEQKMFFLAYHDVLTGLPDKKFLYNRVTEAIKKGEAFGLLYLDIDNFKFINDNFGHDVGDKVLCGFAKTINKVLMGKSFMARVGGDEFILVLFDKDLINEGETLSSINFKDKVYAKVKFIEEIFQKPILIGEMEFTIEASIGTSIYPIQGKEINTLIREADRNMYKIKNEKKILA